MVTQLENKVALDQNGITARLSDQHLLVENLKTANIFDTGSIYIQVSIILILLFYLTIYTFQVVN